MVQAQQWLDKTYPKEQRKEVKKIFARGKNLEGKLVVEGFDSLEKIECGFNNLTSIEIVDLPKLNYFHANGCQITNMVINNCPEIGYLNVGNNLLSETKFLNQLNSEKLTYLSIHSNNFSEQDLSFLSKFTNLEQLFIDNHDEEKFENNVYNRFIGSLRPLRNLEKLKWLNIANTDLSSDLEHLPENLRKICLNDEWDRKNAGYLKIREELEKCSQIVGVTEKLYQEEEGEPEFVSNWHRIAPWQQAQELLLEDKPLVKSLRKQVRELKEEIEILRKQFQKVEKKTKQITKLLEYGLAEKQEQIEKIFKQHEIKFTIEEKEMLRNYLLNQGNLLTQQQQLAAEKLLKSKLSSAEWEEVFTKREELINLQELESEKFLEAQIEVGPF